MGGAVPLPPPPESLHSVDRDNFTYIRMGLSSCHPKIYTPLVKQPVN
jgi:hypothetical protein